MSHPRGDSVHMKRNTQSAAAASYTLAWETGSVDSRRSTAACLPGAKAVRPAKPKAAQGGLLRFCHEIAGLLIRRHLAGIQPEAARQEVRERLIQLMSCSEERAEWLVDLSLELIHVKMHGKFERNPLELSLLIARAGNQLRDLSSN